ncbi:hypothetical protein EST38_g3565 [Candolleomyces aberdarensis]|uniref:Uncharacterized protein n=1 Tax=Candolleomyces aberdarensis TaxID=2316362 RepID=A0A4Q2DQ20_9AGAR|nr:hypothetical protein EST38_g3565 [Candolleomyces aberdarensis]
MIYLSFNPVPGYPELEAERVGIREGNLKAYGIVRKNLDRVDVEFQWLTSA